MPSTSTQNRFCDAYKSTFLKQVYNKEHSRFDPAKATLNSRYMQRRIRSLKVLPNGDLVCQPKPLMFSPVRKHPTTVDLCRPVGIDGYRRTLLLPPSSPKPAKLEETLSPPSARTSESTLNMIARRELLSRELNTVQAQLADEERTLEPKLARLATASSRKSAWGDQAADQGTQRSFDGQSSHRSASTRRRARTPGAASSRRGRNQQWSQRSNASRRPRTALSFNSVAPSFSWADSFNTTYKTQFQRASDATLRRNYSNMKPRASTPARKLSVVRVVPQSPHNSHEAEPALRELAESTRSRHVASKFQW